MATTNTNFKVKNGLDAGGDIATSGIFKSNNSSGDEGGQIDLAKAATNTTIVDGVTLDIYQNKLRIFERGGTNRGFYLDITAGGASVGSNLATGGGGGSGTVTSVAMTVPTGLSISGSPITSSGTLALTLTSGYSIPTTSSQTNWDTAYTQTMRWSGGNSGLDATTGRVSLGATTVGVNIFTLTNPTAITFLKINADNTVTAESDSAHRTSLGLGTMATQSSSSYAALAGATFTGAVVLPKQVNNLIASGYNSASGAFNQTNRVVMVATATGSSAPTTRPDGSSALQAGDIWISW